MKKSILLLLSLIYLFAGCITFSGDVILQPTARDIYSPEGLPEELRHEQIYWQGRMMYLDGNLAMEHDPVKQLQEDLHLTSEPFVVFSHQRRYLLYREVLGRKIGLWDLETGERKWLTEAGRNLPAGARVGGMVFMPGDHKVLFSYMVESENTSTISDLALVDIHTGQVERLHIAKFLGDFFYLSVSPNGKWVVTDIAALNDRVCFLVNLQMRQVECLPLERGWYSRGKFLPDNEYVVYTYHKEVGEPFTIRVSKIDGTENRTIVSGLVNAEIELVAGNEVVFVSGIYGEVTCGFVYVVHQDGSDLRRLVYLGKDCAKKSVLVP